MEEGVEQVNYFKAGVLMLSKNLVTTGAAQGCALGSANCDQVF